MHISGRYQGDGLLRNAALAQTGSEALYYCIPAGKKNTDISGWSKNSIPKLDRLLQFDKFIIALSNTRR